MISIRTSFSEEDTQVAVLNNSITVKVGDVIAPVSGQNGIVTNATAVVAGAVYPLGLVIGFVGPNETVIGNGDNPINTPAQITTAADNTTNAKYGVKFIVLRPNQTFTFDLSQAAGTTSHSDYPYVWFNLSDANTVDETSVIDTTNGSAPLQILSLGLVSGSTTQIIGKFAKPLFGRTA